MSEMKFGKYKGRDFSEVPASYLLWAYKNVEYLDADLKKYIEKNMKQIRKEYLYEEWELEIIMDCAGDRDNW